jgi:hypothetical protein
MASKNQRTPSTATLTREQEYELLHAVEQGDEHTVMVDWLKRYPDLTDEIIAFVSALRIFDEQSDEAIYATADVVEHGIAKGLARVTTVAAAPALDLKAALEVAGMTKTIAARRLQIGVDVLQKLMQGRITVATIPQRFFERLGQALESSVEQARQLVNQSFELGVQVQPAYRRGAAKTPKDIEPAPPESFADAVQRSPNMAADVKKEWLG